MDVEYLKNLMKLRVSLAKHRDIYTGAEETKLLTWSKNCQETFEEFIKQLQKTYNLDMKKLRTVFEDANWPWEDKEY